MTLKSRGPIPLYYESLYAYMNPITLLGFFSSFRNPQIRPQTGELTCAIVSGPACAGCTCVCCRQADILAIQHWGRLGQVAGYRTDVCGRTRYAFCDHLDSLTIGPQVGLPFACPGSLPPRAVHGGSVCRMKRQPTVGLKRIMGSSSL